MRKHTNATQPTNPEKEKMNFTHKVDHQHNTQLRPGI